MAYKFQIGAAKLSGSITQTDGSGDLRATTVDSLNASNGGISAAGAISGATTISGSGTISGGGLVIAGSTVSAAGLALIDDADADAQRTTLGLVIGTNVQAYDAELAALAGLTSEADKGIQFTGTGTAATYTLTTAGKALLDDADADAQRTTLGLVIGTNVQAYDAELAAIAGLTSAADKGIQFTGDGTAATYDLTAAGKALLDDANALAQRNTLELGTSNNVEFANITGVTGSFTGDLTVSGDLTVQGEVVAIEATHLRVVDKLIEIASGSADDLALDGGGIQFNSGDGNKTLTFQASGDNLASSEHFNIANTKVYKINNTEVLSADGAAKVQSAVAGNGLAHSDGVLSLANATNGGLTINADDMQLNLNDLAAVAVAVADDSIAIIDASDNSTKKESIADLVSAMAGGGLTATNGVLATAGYTPNARAHSETLTVGMNYFADLTTTQAEVTLPSSPSLGDLIYVKAGDLDASSDILIQPDGGTSHTIDGEPAVVLESPFAAVTLIYVASNDWRIV